MEGIEWEPMEVNRKWKRNERTGNQTKQNILQKVSKSLGHFTYFPMYESLLEVSSLDLLPLY